MGNLLECRNLSITFGEHCVIQNLNFNVPKGSFVSIIGPNGAGKTTLFNLLSGELSPTKGDIYFKNQNITKFSVPNRTRLGIGRSFQLTNVFPDLTVLENVRLAIQSVYNDYYSFFTRPSHYRKQQEEAKEYLKTVLLQGKEDILAKNLAHGEKRKLEIAMILALKPDLLLLDEPTAGISLEEAPAILQVIENIKEEKNKTIVLIEHKMEMVLHLSDSLVVLFHGELLAEGEPSVIINDELVQSAYLGGLHSDSIKSR
ncbi:ABC transporter ATP-binding protein [Bacillus massilinigeriensis]|uniref:ABC transporter ATP-binding protein n=1 Tax=Bacillus massilionigeriensis TaxID=1805475 RepID=UPI00096B4B10|nr:ABC transporter ATP-binding protein [Bacillus massilionigeriensis]